MIRKILLAAFTLVAIQQAVAKGEEEMPSFVSFLTEPAAWRSLGTLDPGVEQGVPHDVYRNSAVIAATIAKQGVNVPYTRLATDPQQAREMFKSYLTSVIGDKNFKADEKSCGIGVAHLYSGILAQYLRSRGPKWVNPGLSDQAAIEAASTAAGLILPARQALATLCDTWRYREVARAYDAFLKRIDGEMPYLLNQGLPISKVRDDKILAEKAASDQLVVAGERSLERRNNMLTELSSIGLKIADPYAACMDYKSDPTALQKNQCMSNALNAEQIRHTTSFKASLAGVSKSRTQEIVSKHESFNSQYYGICNKAQAAGKSPDESEQQSSEIFYRCAFVQLRKNEAERARTPIKTDVQLGADLYTQSQTLRVANELTDESRTMYLSLLQQSSELGNMDAKLALATANAADLSDIKSLDMAERLLNQVEQARGTSTETVELRNKISGPLQEYRFAHSPAQLRKTHHASMASGSDDAERAALAMDDMSRAGGMCDNLVVQAYGYAANKNMDENIRVIIITDKLIGAAAKIGCIR